MSSGNIYMTPEGYEEAQKKLEALKQQRMEVSEEIGRARGFGDISENAEYHAAKEKQALVEERIAELENKLSRAQIMDDVDAPSDKVLLGTTVTLADTSGDLEMTYTMVSELESDPDAGKISITSPIGQAALGHKEGDVISVDLPKGVMEFTIKKIERL